MFMPLPKNLVILMSGIMSIAALPIADPMFGGKLRGIDTCVPTNRLFIPKGFDGL
jgi:hypothetical protein